MIGAYKRLSIADGDLNERKKDMSNSIENQGKLIKNYLAAYDEFKDIPVVEYIDDGYTGTNFNRPAFQKMMEAIKSGIIDTVIVKDLSRFGRDYIEVGKYIEEIFPVLDIRFIAINNAFDSKNSDYGTIGLDMAVSNLVNTLYSRDIGKKLVSANKIKWAKGIPTSGLAPYGYKIDPKNHKHYLIDKPAAKVVKKIFSLAIAGNTTTAIRDYLNDHKILIPTEYNKQNKVAGKDTHYILTPHGIWNNSKILLILKNYTYTGAMVLGKNKTIIAGKKKVISIPRTEQYITENMHTPIVTHEEFIMAQAIIKTSTKGVMKPHIYALKKKIRCGYCHRVMFCDTKGSEERMCCAEGISDLKHSFCSDERYSLQGLEDTVLEKLKELFLFLDKIKTKTEDEKAKTEKIKGRIEILKSDTDLKICKVQKKKTELYERYVEGELTLKEYKAEKARADKQIENYSDVVKKAEEKFQTIKVKEIPLEVQTLINQMDSYRSLDCLTQEVVKLYIDCVYVYSTERLDIRFRYQDEIKKTAKAFGISVELFDGKATNETQVG